MLVVAARQLGDLPSGLTDSKLLSKSRREAVYKLLTTKCYFGEGWVTPSEVDYHGLAESLRLGAARALGKLNILPLEEIVIDGKINYVAALHPNSRAVVGADKTVAIVSAASVYAKVQRDKYMARLSRKHSDYGFEKNVGYGTAKHRRMIARRGPIADVHRMSFRPMKDEGI